MSEAFKKIASLRRIWIPCAIAAIAVFIGMLFSRNAELAGRLNELMESYDGPWNLMRDKSFPYDSLFPKEMRSQLEAMFGHARQWYQTRDFKVGRNLSEQGAKPRHPVILLPGIVTSGLESWSTTQDEAPYFRTRLWGSSSMIRKALLNKDHWVRHLMLDPETGLDPENMRVRAAQGLDAASYFAAGYWVWSKLIENLAAVGYDINDIYLASYDWRLSMGNLEVRDHFYSRIMAQIEFNSRVYGEKTVLVSHSMGGTLALYLLKWLEYQRGSKWIDNHIEALTSLSGTFFGVPKSLPALMTGEMRDTVQVPDVLSNLLEYYFSAQERAELFRTWAGSASLITKGGDAVWGGRHGAPDDMENSTMTHGIMMEYAEHKKDNKTESEKKLTMDEVYPWLAMHTDKYFQRMLHTNYSYGIERDPRKLRANNKDPTKWANPLEVTLPHAPNMKIYCIYGWNKPTERSYWMKEVPPEDALNERSPAGSSHSQTLRNDSVSKRSHATSRIDGTFNDENAIPTVNSGVRMGEGDGTVPLLSLGAMCVHGWHMERYNPARIKVVTHEVMHNPEAYDLRGGVSSGDHIDILGSHDLNEAVVRIATGLGDTVEERIYSPIREYSKKIQW